MFGFFKRNKREDPPLSDLKTVSRWMQEMPSGDIYTALENVVQTLIQFNHAGQPPSRERLQVLMHLDEQARDMQFALCTQYLPNAQASEFASAAPLIAARAMRGFADIFKWRYIRYERIEDKLWGRLHNLYRMAEQGDFLANRFKLYPADPKPTSCSEEYIQPLLLAPLGTGNLAPRQIELVDHSLDNWSELPRIDTEYDPKLHCYFVDFSQGFEPRPIQSGAKTQPEFRYLNTHPVLSQLSEVEKSLRSGTLPAALGLGEDFRLPDGYDLIDHVFKEWAPRGDRDRRYGVRRPASGRVEVMHELTNICHLLEREDRQLGREFSKNALSPEELLAQKLYGGGSGRPQSQAVSPPPLTELPPLQQWNLYDRGDTGIGVLLPAEEGDWIKIGKLVCFRSDPADSWRLGVVRRITRQQNESRRIGILLMPTPPTLIQLESIDPGFSTPNARQDNLSHAQQFSALLTSNSKGQQALVLDTHKYAHGRLFRATHQRTTSFLQLGAACDKGDGWLLASYTEQAEPTV